MEVFDSGQRGMSSAIYASFGCNTHDLRFVRSLSKQFDELYHLRFDGLSHQLTIGNFPNNVTQVEWIGTQSVLTRENIENFLEPVNSILVNLDVDVILAGPIPSIGYICSRQRLTPVVLLSWAYDLLIDINNFPDDKERSIEAFRDSAGVIVDCNTVASIARQFGMPETQICISPWGIELNDFTPGGEKTSDGVFRVLSTRSLEKIYDVETLVRAASLIRTTSPDFKFEISIVGDGTEKARLQELANHLDLQGHINWFSRVEENKIRALILKHNLYISTAISDGSSISMLQAMACEQLVLVSNIESNKEWISDNWNGWLFNVGDASDLSTKILAIAGHPKPGFIGSNASQQVHERANWESNSLLIQSFIHGVS